MCPLFQELNHAFVGRALKKNAVIYWPAELIALEKASSVIPLLLETQDAFISVLHIASKTPFGWMDALDLSDDLYPNLFLKHLCVLSDIGGESLMRFSSELAGHFPENVFEFTYRNRIHEYHLESLTSSKKWSNGLLGLTGKKLTKKLPLTPAMKDVSMLVLFGGLATNAVVPDEIENKCILGSLLGEKERLERFVKQRYIWVSRITGGAKSNAMGQLAQRYVKDQLRELLPDWDFSGSTIPGISQNEGRTLTKFDIVGTSPQGDCWGIEVSFQFTTNSVVERKAKLAKDRLHLLRSKGHRVAYVVDGAGNFERRSYVQDLIDFSDCIVNFSLPDIQRLATKMRGSVENDTPK